MILTEDADVRLQALQEDDRCGPLGDREGLLVPKGVADIPAGQVRLAELVPVPPFLEGQAGFERMRPRDIGQGDALIGLIGDFVTRARDDPPRTGNRSTPP